VKWRDYLRARHFTELKADLAENRGADLLCTNPTFRTPPAGYGHLNPGRSSFEPATA